MTLQSEVPSQEQGHAHHAYTELGGSGVRPPLQRRMHHYFEATCDRLPSQTALEWEGGSATYRELDEAANRMAHLIRSRYEVAGRRVGLLVPRSRDLYVALLAIQKADAAWVPIDPSSPADRIEYFAQDSDLALLLTTSEFTDVLEGLDVERLHLDGIEDELADQPSARPELDLEGDPTAYVIYTSGSTGRPKGVDIRQSSICNFLHVITELYDVRASDRVYQGMTISFDFAIEEVWPTWCVGAALIAGPTDGRRVGAGLTTFLEERAITLLYVVPTVLSTVERTIDSIRALMVGGEACPSELVERWAPGRRMLNTYGPTEATVTCTVGILEPGRPVTIGIAVPTYTAWILDDQRRPVPQGGDGELCIGGVGVAAGYLNRPDLTADHFIPHPENSDERIYRTGDLARIDERGEIVYLGRADAEVKIRGHRVDLGEIESVLMRAEGVHTAAVKHLRSGQTGDEISGYLVPHAGTPRSDERLLSLHDHLRDVLPPYMVPAYLEWVDELPMLPSGKVDRKQLPDPTSARLVGGSGEIVPASTEMERWVLGVWAATFGLEPDQLSVEANFFDDLGGHSLVAANVTSAMRRDGRGAPMSIMDLYANPSVRTLAQHLDLSALGDDSDRGDEEQVVQARETLRYSSWRVALFGFAQFLVVFAIVAFGTLPFAVIYALHEGRPSMAMLQEICLMFPVAYLAERWLLPLLVARLFGAGLREGEHRLYGWTHLRVWLVTRAMSLSPMVNLAGSAFAARYLRLAGATIGRGCHIGSELIPVPSLLHLDDGATIGYATHLLGTEITDGRLVIGRVHLGRSVTVGANCVIAGPSHLGDGSVLRDQSAVQSGQQLPAGSVWQGSPAERRDTVDDPILEIMADCSQAPREWSPALKRRFAWGLVALEFAPLIALLPVVVLVWWVMIAFGLWPAFIITCLTGPVFVTTSCLVILALRRFGLPSTPVGIHHLRSRLGVEKWFADKLLSLSLLQTNTLYSTVYTPWWLRKLGAKIGARSEVSTIANIDPDLLTIGEESFVADMASVGSATYCNGHVAFRPTTIGKRAFVGNAAFVPSGNYLGDNSLLGVGSVPPTSGVPAGSSWLGSPSFYLPKREIYEEFTEEQTFAPSRWLVVARYVIEALRIVLPSSILAVSLFLTLNVTSMLAQEEAAMWQLILAVPALALTFGLGVVVFIALMKWLIVGRYKPRVEALWSLFVRRTEFVTGVYEAAAVPALLMLLQGTPMLGPVLRLYGMHVGRRSLIDTTYVTEFDLVRLGDDVAIGPAVSLQTHLFEDRVMKMNEVRVGDRVSAGTRTVILYQTDVGDDVDLAPLSLVMKGESLPAASAWAGIPAQPARRPQEPTDEPHPTRPSRARRRPPRRRSARAHTDLSAHRGPVDTDASGTSGASGTTGTAGTVGAVGGTAGAADDGSVAASVPWRPIVDHDDAVRFPHACEPNEDGEYIDEYDPPRPSRRRLVGLDVARGIALIGMIAIHTMTSDDGDGNMSLAWILALGKASALFAVLSGVGLAFITGRRAAPRGWLAPRMSLVTVVRGTVVLLIGLLLGAFVPGAEVMVVLPYLGVMFIVAGLLVSLRTRTLLVLGFAWTIIGPVISHLVRSGLPPVAEDPTNLTLASLASPIDTFTVIFFTGSFPVITWMAYVCIGMALGRSNLAARSTIGLMTVGGLALTLGTVLLSQFFVHGAGFYERLASDVSDRMSLDTFTDFVVFGSSGQLPTDSWWWLAVNAPHTGTPLDLLYTIGISLAVIGSCLALTSVFAGRFALLAVPGSMTLTMYALHALLVGPMSELPDLLIFGLHVVGLTTLALAWSNFFQRGPLEEIVARITNLVRPTRNSRIYARGGAYKRNGQVVA